MILLLRISLNVRFYALRKINVKLLLFQIRGELTVEFCLLIPLERRPFPYLIEQDPL